jgi:hypothetical protein
MLLAGVASTACFALDATHPAHSAVEAAASPNIHMVTTCRMKLMEQGEGGEEEREEGREERQGECERVR